MKRHGRNERYTSIHQFGLVSLVVIGAAMLTNSEPAISEATKTFALIESYPDVRQVTRVEAGGEITVIDLGSTATGLWSYWHGTDTPVPASNGQLIAFIKNNNLWVRDLSTGKDSQLTTLGTPDNKEYASVDVLIMKWSAESDRIVYSVNSGPTSNGDDDPEIWTKKERAAEYGFHIYDMRAGKSRRIEPPMTIVGWVKGNEILLEGKSQPSNQPGLFVWEPEKGPPKEIPVPLAQFNQIDISPDRTHAVVNAGSYIATFDLRSGVSKPVESSGGFGDYQFPRFSPDGRRIAYIDSTDKSSVRGVKQTRVKISDGKSMGPFVGPIRYKWIDNDSIAVAHLCGLTVARVSTGRSIKYRKHVQEYAKNLGLDCSKPIAAREIPK